MLVPPLPRPRSLLSGLGCAVLLHGASDALRTGPAMFTCYVLLGLALVVPWRRRTAVAGQASRPMLDRSPSLVWARLAQDEPPRGPTRVRGRASPTPPEPRGFWARVKLWVGGVGCVLSAVWWLLLAAMLIMPDPSPTLDGLFTASLLTLVAVSLLLSVLFLVILRSGLRGPSDPLAPDESVGQEYLRSQPSVPGSVPGPQRVPGKKPHLRLVRDAR